MTDTLLRAAGAAGVLAFVLVGLVRRHALRRGFLDHPTERSSHAVPTPRGGGLGLLLAVLMCWIWRATHSLAWPELVAIAGAAAVASVGWMDDRRGVTVRIRLAVHIVAALCVGALATSGRPASLLLVALFIAWTLWAVSTVNVVNFMDGINGLVASQIAVFALSLALLPDSSDGASFYAVVVAAACVGFLPWNFPRARIFLGDVGSGGLGYLIPVLALLAVPGQGIDLARAFLPLLPLFADATFTMLRRWRNGERLTEAHRSHLYQRLANGGLGHAPVTGLYLGAALAGAFIAHLSRPTNWVLWMALYGAAVVAGGIILDRRANGTVRG